MLREEFTAGGFLVARGDDASAALLSVAVVGYARLNFVLLGVGWFVWFFSATLPCARHRASASVGCRGCVHLRAKVPP